MQRCAYKHDTQLVHRARTADRGGSSSRSGRERLAFCGPKLAVYTTTANTADIFSMQNANVRSDKTHKSNLGGQKRNNNSASTTITSSSSNNKQRATPSSSCRERSRLELHRPLHHAEQQQQQQHQSSCSTTVEAASQVLLRGDSGTKQPMHAVTIETTRATQCDGLINLIVYNKGNVYCIDFIFLLYKEK